MSSNNLLVISHNNLGSSLSGGDRIFLNFIKYLPDTISADFLGAPEAITLLKKFKIKPDRIYQSCPVSPVKNLSTLNLFLHQLIRIFFTFHYFFTHFSFFSKFKYIFTASDFPSDSLFGILTKIFHPHICWIASYYLAAPNPFDPQSPYNQNHRFFRGLIYYVGQIPILLLTRIFANLIFVTSDPDVKLFPGKKVFVIQGGVDIPKSPVSSTIRHRPYDALYIGRLHVQKGVLKLIDIWRLVVDSLPSARLAIIGDGELLAELKSKIKSLRLTSNIRLFGFQIGSGKIEIIKNSKIVVHPAVYDSGGMAAAEAMAYGLPAVGFDLPALKTYYPQGMLKSRPRDISHFSQNILTLLSDRHLYRSLSRQARQLIINHWSWQLRFTPIYTLLK